MKNPAPQQQQAQQPTHDLGWVGYDTYSGGVNMAARNGRELKPNQLAGMVNCTVRGGFVSPRDGYKWLSINYASTEVEQRFQAGLAQGVCYYQRDNDSRLIYAVGGWLFSFNPLSRRMSALHPPLTATPFNPGAPFVYMCERAGSVAAQDGTSAPMIITGSSVRVPKSTKGEMYGGRVMGDGWGRLVLSSKDGSRVTMSNHEADPTSRAFDFTEGNDYFLNAPFFVIPQACGKIISVAFVQYVDTASGLGPCIVFCTRGTMTYDVSQPRNTWATANIARMTLPKIGACANRCVTGGAASLYFRDQHGRIRNLQTAIASSKSITVLRFDREVSPILKMENPKLRAWHGVVEYDDRALFTALPENVQVVGGNDVRHRGLLAWNTDVIASTQETHPAVWEGIHTGLRPQLIVSGQFEGTDFSSGETKVLIMSLDSDNRRRVYEQVTGQRFDIAPTPGGNRAARKSIEWQVSTRWFDWNRPMDKKKITSAVLNMDDIRGRLKIEGFFRVSESDEFTPWFTHHTGVDDQLKIGAKGCIKCGLSEASPLTLDRWAMPAMPEGNASDGSDIGKFLRCQFLFRFTGWGQLREMSFEASLNETGLKARTETTAPADLRRIENCPWNMLTYDALTAPAYV